MIAQSHAGKPALTLCLPGMDTSVPMANSVPMWQFEQAAMDMGFHRVAGVDEAGRGPLAGPIVAAAVVLCAPVAGLNDSKQLTEVERDRLFSVLHEGGHAIGIAVISAEEIDRMGIQSANYAAMLQALAALEPAPDHLLVDGYRLPACPVPHQRIVKGDCLSQSIAAASIVAKVTRDRIMLEMDVCYPEYGFARHKGYGTRRHLDALAHWGPCPIHRRSFAPLACKPQETSQLPGQPVERV
ncbi:MAG: ribonuclease HII [Candidatus Hydrogenedentota bacterium]